MRSPAVARILLIVFAYFSLHTLAKSAWGVPWLPSLAMMPVIWFAWREGLTPGLMAAVPAGLLEDLLSAGPFGLGLLSNGVLAVLAALFKQIFMYEDRLHFMGLAIAAVLIRGGLDFLGFVLEGGEWAGARFLVLVMAKQLALGTGAAWFTFLILGGMDPRFRAVR
ncbi:MAG: hypothetical protein HYY14_01215 [Candidatus Omnitrophica bacterium]|nr:hypothetical protein [Candidatus Omnitrophota bacterium]